MDDIRSIENTYNNEKGTFLVILEDSQLMGMGAIKHLDDRSCELTRMFFAREYRNKGYGSLLMQQLMLFAKESGYERVKLNIWNSHTQSNAIAFYKKFGFYTIEPYKVCAAKVFMEKEL
jgi:ribosomal protein S18 acetylase RimI-like enzyme